MGKPRKMKKSENETKPPEKVLCGLAAAIIDQKKRQESESQECPGGNQKCGNCATNPTIISPESLIENTGEGKSGCGNCGGCGGKDEPRFVAINYAAEN